jgi:hypothetical protein
MEFAEASEADAASSSRERGRLEDSVIADREEIEESSMLRGVDWLKVVEDDEWETGGVFGCWLRVEPAAPLVWEACWAWGIVGADEVRFSFLRLGL